jgi:uncharacterized protein (TIGR02231 family)
MADPVMEAPIIVEETATAGRDFDDGINATFVYDQPVTLASDIEGMRIALGALTFTPDVYAQANPRSDSTAFLMAELSNNGAELLLPSEEVTYYLNGQFIGAGHLPLIAQGDTHELAFGPINGLQLTHTVLDRISGDTGVITSRNQRSETNVVTAENFTDQTWDLRLFDRVPYSEQEDLVITHQTTPRSDHTDYKDQRGILVWETELLPDQSFEATIKHEVKWPTDKILR